MEVINLNASEVDAWDTYLNQTHQSASNISHPVLHHSDLHSRYVLKHGDSWIGHGATRIVDLNINGIPMPFGLIGALYLDHGYKRMRQQQALQAYSNIVSKAIQDLRASGCVGAILPEQDNSYFSKLGFIPHHNEWWVHIPRSQILIPKRIPTPFFIQHGLSNTCSSFIVRQIMDLYNQFSEGASRTPEQWTAILQQPNMLYSIVLHKDQMVGYFLMSKVGSKNHVVHECSAPTKEVLFYGLSALGAYLEDDLYIMGPEAHLKSIVNWSRSIFDRSTFYKGNMGLLTLFKPHLLLEQWAVLNAETLKSKQLRLHQTTPISLDFYHHADLVHKLELHKEFNFLFEANLSFLVRRNRPAPALQPIRLYTYWADQIVL
jgi:hypothetical protein